MTSDEALIVAGRVTKDFSEALALWIIEGGRPRAEAFTPLDKCTAMIAAYTKFAELLKQERLEGLSTELKRMQ